MIIKANGNFLAVADFHGEPYRCCTHYMKHYTKELFLFWHSVYVQQMEDALAEFLLDPTLGLPYWDWTEPWDHSLPFIGDMSLDKKNPWSFSYNSVIQRNTFRELSPFKPKEYKEIIENNICHRDFLKFVVPLDSVHVQVHFMVGGDMATVAYSAMDPTFFLHHSQIEKLFHEYMLCQEDFYGSSWINALPKEIMETPLTCFNNPAINKDPQTFNQTINKVLQQFRYKHFEYELDEKKPLQCKRNCEAKPDGPFRYLVFNMNHIQISGRLIVDICLPSLNEACYSLGPAQIDYFGIGSKTLRNPVMKDVNHAFYLDITKYLKEYSGYHNNDTWLATVPVEAHVVSFKDYLGKKDLPLQWIDIYPYSVYQAHTEAAEVVQVSWNQPHMHTMFKSLGTTMEFTYDGIIVDRVWEFENKAAFIACDESKLRELKLPIQPDLGQHFFYNKHRKHSRCTKWDKLSIHISKKP